MQVDPESTCKNGILNPKEIDFIAQSRQTIYHGAQTLCISQADYPNAHAANWRWANSPGC